MRTRHNGSRGPARAVAEPDRTGTGLGAAIRCREGRGPELGEWPIIDRNALRSSYASYVRPECSWLAVATAGEVAAPVPVHRSVRSIAASQAFMDDLLGVWDSTFAASRVARLRGDDVKADAEGPPYGAYRNRGRTLVLSAKHLSRATIRWFS